MSRPIIMTDAMKRKARKDFSSMLDDLKMLDGKLNYSHSYAYKDCNAIVWITQEAYRKILFLVTEFNDEVGWHGTISRPTKNEFIIEDIFVYPQEVTGSTVNTNQEAYTQWLYELNDSVFNCLRLQGHSHCNMGVSPSGVDNSHRQSILDQLEHPMFYVFMIWNKSMATHTVIYDMAQNILYENNDVDVKLLKDEAVEIFCLDAKEKVKKKSKNVAVSEPYDKYIDTDHALPNYYSIHGLGSRYGIGGVYGDLKPI